MVSAVCSPQLHRSITCVFSVREHLTSGAQVFYWRSACPCLTSFDIFPLFPGQLLNFSKRDSWIWRLAPSSYSICNHDLKCKLTVQIYFHIGRMFAVTSITPIFNETNSTKLFGRNNTLQLIYEIFVLMISLYLIRNATAAYLKHPIVFFGLFPDQLPSLSSFSPHRSPTPFSNHPSFPCISSVPPYFIPSAVLPVQSPALLQSMLHTFISILPFTICTFSISTPLHTY